MIRCCWAWRFTTFTENFNLPLIIFVNYFLPLFFRLMTLKGGFHYRSCILLIFAYFYVI